MKDNKQSNGTCYVFRNASDEDLYGLSSDRDGRNLPREEGEWLYAGEYREGAIDGKEMSRDDSKAARAAVGRQGYYVWQSPESGEQRRPERARSSGM